MLVSGYNNIILLPNCTLLYYVFSGPLSLCAYVPEIKFNNNNNKSALQHFETLLPIGKADHDIVYIEINARPNRQNTPHRNVFIFRNANWDGIKSKLSTLLNNMQSSTEQTSVNTQWTIFKTTLLNSMQEFIPQKQIKPKHCLPWVTQRIRKLIRAKYRLHSKLKHNPRPDTKDKYKQASHTLQKKTCKAYWAYLENIIDYTPEPNTQDRHQAKKILVLHQIYRQ